MTNSLMNSKELIEPDERRSGLIVFSNRNKGFQLCGVGLIRFGNHCTAVFDLLEICH